MTGKINLKVLIIDRDFYALESLNSYLGWDRRTRVIALTSSVDEANTYLARLAEAELPDVILLDAEISADVTSLRVAVDHFRKLIKHVMVICLAHTADGQRATAAVDAGVRGYLLRNEVKVHIVGAICYALDHDLVVTPGIRDAAENPFDTRIFHATVLPAEREFPGMTDRIRQALWLCVIEGMPAHLAADEMGVSPHTIRSYIKEGYRILEAYDDKDYPDEMGPLERAFMRFTALEDDEAEVRKRPKEQ